MVIYTACDDEAMAKLNAWCAEHDTDRQQRFERLDVDAAGGVKVFTCEVWAMAGNYFPYEGLVEVFPSFGWRYPEDAILIVDDAHVNGSQVIRAAAVANHG